MHIMQKSVRPDTRYHPNTPFLYHVTSLKTVGTIQVNSSSNVQYLPGVPLIYYWYNRFFRPLNDISQRNRHVPYNIPVPVYAWRITLNAGLFIVLLIHVPTSVTGRLSNWQSLIYYIRA